MDKVENTLVDLMECLALCEGIDKDTQQDILILMARLGDDIEAADHRSHPMNNEHQDHKEDEGVKWEPGVDLPPVGWAGECTWGTKELWHKCVMLYDGEVAIYPRWAPSIRIDKITDHEFRPIQSHRDKVIEAAMKKVSQDFGNDPAYADCITTTDFIERAVIQIHNAGMLKLPGEEE